METAKDKLEWLSESQIELLDFDLVSPDKNNNWINQNENEWEELIPVVDKDVKSGKRENAIFKLFSRGIATQRDEWVFDFDKKNLEAKAKFLSDKFNVAVKDNVVIDVIKWSRDLKNKLTKGNKSKFDKKYIVDLNYRPYTIQNFYSERIFCDVLTQSHFDCFGPELNKENKVINILGYERRPFAVLASGLIPNLNYFGDPSKYISLYKYDQQGNRHDNITDWGLSQFTTHYKDTTITKEAIFYYTYAVLHNPEYRKKYELNLKREFPRLPFYDDFNKWAAWGRQLMELHIDYETVTPFDLQVIDNSNIKDKNYKLKVKLKADKANGIIAIDEHTHIVGVPSEAWEYKLGNRSALEWVLDQYKEKKYTDKTIAENFNTYRFADYKPHVIDLLKRVCTVSVETMKVIKKMG